jgi:uncharacterized protein YlxP (DUF503 family)
MNVGVCKIRLRLPGNTSLKEKRRVLKSITTQLKNRFNISVAEVDDHNLWQKAVLGICFISNNSRYTTEGLSKVLNLVASSRFEIEVLDCETEIITF